MSSQPIRPGHRIGKYEILAHIATGGMGKVFKARDLSLGRVVALKVLSTEMASKPAALERFRREAIHVARLSHKNVVTLYECGEEDGQHFLALEYVQGIDLYEYIERKGQLPPEEARRILLQALKALDHAFQNGIIHRDIKPSNFLLATENNRLRVKLTDLGLARTTGDEEQFRVTRAGSTVGTIDYLSPEQARDSSTADVRSDIYSLGCTFYHMLAGKPPFAEGGLGERVYKHMQAEPPDVRLFNPRVSEGLWGVLQRMLAKVPEDRYQTPAEVLRAIKNLSDPAGGAQVVQAASLQPNHEPLTSGAGYRPDSSGEFTPVPPRSRPPSSGDLPAAVTPEEMSPQSVAIPPPPPPPLRDDPIRLGVSGDQVQAASGQFERAMQAFVKNNLEYALDLLFSCCKLDPLNTHYRQKLREVGRAVTARKARGGWLSGMNVRRRFKSARRAGDLRLVLEHGEELLLRNADDVRTHLDMAEASEESGMGRLAAWLFDQARQQAPENLLVLRSLARHYEKLKDFQQAISTWDQVAKADPKDPEAPRKVQNLSANYAISRNRFRS